MLSSEGRFLARTSQKGLCYLASEFSHTIGWVGILAPALTYMKTQVGKVAHIISRIEVFCANNFLLLVGVRLCGGLQRTIEHDFRISKARNKAFGVADFQVPFRTIARLMCARWPPPNFL